GTIDFSQASYDVVESAGIATITVSRNGNPLIPESVHYATANVTATAGSDYTATAGTLTLGIGEMSKTFSVPIADDQAFEGDESADSVAASGSLPFAPGETVKTFPVSIINDSANEGNETLNLHLSRNGGPDLDTPVISILINDNPDPSG